MARTDRLTGAMNLRAFYESVEEELARGARYGHPFSLIYLDVDDFKVINNTLDHQGGDRLLELLVGTILAHIRSTDVISRLGGDEFAVLLPETAGDAAVQIAHKLRGALLSELQVEHLRVTVSMGAITCMEPSRTVDDLIRIADVLMYEAKSKGKDHMEHRVVRSSGV